MHASKHVIYKARFALILALVGSGFAQETSPVTKLAADIFGKLEVRLVRCPAYTHGGGNQPVCGVSDLTPEAFTEAFDEAAKGKLEPQSPWDEDHTVWLRRYSAGGVAYAAIYSEIARDFNVQLVKLK
jgi:hypothetical protein